MWEHLNLKVLFKQKYYLASLNHLNKLDYTNKTKGLDEVEVVTIVGFHFLLLFTTIK